MIFILWAIKTDKIFFVVRDCALMPGGIVTDRQKANDLKMFILAAAIKLPTTGRRAHLPRHRYQKFLSALSKWAPDVLFDAMEALDSCSKNAMLSRALFKYLNNDLTEIKFSPTGRLENVEFVIKLFTDYVHFTNS